MKVKNTLSFDGSVVESENYNSSFYKVKMKVFAFGDNRNGSNFSPESFTSDAQKSIHLIPIVAKYNTDEDDLESHNVSLKKNANDEYEFFYDTYPIGVVSTDSNITLEEVNEGSDEQPDIKTYVVVDNIFLWKRYDATKKIISWLEEGVSPKISMEIDNVTGQFSDNGYFQIDSFEFQAIAALGSEIEPCFPRAEIETFSAKTFKDEFKALVYELNETLNLDKQGGTEMEDTTKVEEQFEEKDTVVDTVVTKQEEKDAETFEAEKTDEETEVKDAQEFEKEAEKEEEEEIPSTQEFALTANQLRDQLRAELGKEHYHDTWGDKCRKYYLIDNTDALVIFENTQENYQLYAAPFTLNGDNVELQLDQAYKVKVEYVAFEGDAAIFSERFEVEQSAIQSELAELKSYKRTREEDDIKAKFADKLSEDEFTQVFEAMKESAIEDVEDKLFALYGKKNFSISKPATQVNKVNINVKQDVKDNPYKGFFN